MPELRDEIYVQLVCQLCGNPCKNSAYRGWQLIQVLLVTFPPTHTLAPVLRQFLMDQKNPPKPAVTKSQLVPVIAHPAHLYDSNQQTSEDERNCMGNHAENNDHADWSQRQYDHQRALFTARVGIIARYALSKLDTIVSRGPRGKIPNDFEISAYSEAAFQPTVFGETLQRIMSLQSEAYPDAKVPIILSFLADVGVLINSNISKDTQLISACSRKQGIIALGGLKKFGLFRIAGDPNRVNELRLTVDQGRYTFVGYEDVHVAASLLRLWLRELATPLIPESWYARCLDAVDMDDETM